MEAGKLSQWRSQGDKRIKRQVTNLPQKVVYSCNPRGGNNANSPHGELESQSRKKRELPTQTAQRNKRKGRPKKPVSKPPDCKESIAVHSLRTSVEVNAQRVNSEGECEINSECEETSASNLRSDIADEEIGANQYFFFFREL